MSRIKEVFQNKKALIAFITCGDPDFATTKKIILEMVANGVDLIELGIPFSDPMAEGVVIQDANRRAMENGITTDDVFDFVATMKAEIEVPLCFMTYSNVVFSYGASAFMEKCKETGIEGIVLPDLPFEEKGEFMEVADAFGIDLISLIAPTSKDRIAMIAKEAKGFIYLVSSLGVTGVRSKIDTDLESIVAMIREYTDVPVAIGFGISNPSQARDMADISDGVIVGSAIIKLIEEHKENAPKVVGEFVKKMRASMDRA